jgi:peptide/nickel transport system substrate-binding protein
LRPAQDAALPRPAHAVVLRTVHDENARILRLEAGRADVALNVVSPTLLPALGHASALAVTARPGANLTYIVVNEDHGRLGDRAVRRGLSLAVDRELVCATLLDGKAHPATGLLPAASWAHGDGAPFPFDPAEARALLVGGDDAPLHVGLLTSTERLRGDIARFIAQELRAVGVEAEVTPLELGTMIARLNGGDFDLAILQLPEVTEPNVLRRFLHGASIPPAGANRGHVRDPVFDALLDEGEETALPEKRRAVYARLEARERDEMHWLPLWSEDQVAVTSVRARAFLPSAEGRWLSLSAIP